MIKLLVEHQESQVAKKITVDNSNQVMKKMNQENLDLSKQLASLRKDIEQSQSDILLKNQIIEVNQVNYVQEKRQLESDFEAL